MTSQATRRPYRMVARARSAAETVERILHTATELFARLPYDQVTLSAVAEGAQVTVQTVMRHFGCKERLFTEVGDRRGRLIREQRDRAPVGDTAAAVRNAVEQYERWGDVLLHLLAQESRAPEVRRRTDAGREYHREWVRRIFEPLLGALPARERERRLAQLLVATDLGTWRTLRRDLGLDRRAVERCMVDMAKAILARGPDRRLRPPQRTL